MPDPHDRDLDHPCRIQRDPERVPAKELQPSRSLGLMALPAPGLIANSLTRPEARAGRELQRCDPTDGAAPMKSPRVARHNVGRNDTPAPVKAGMVHEHAGP
jgi:hypothetical protein